MEQTISLQISSEWVKDIPQEDLTLQQIFRLGLYQYHIERAINLYKSGIGTLGYIAQQTGIPKQALIKEMRLRDIEPDFSDQTLMEETTHSTHCVFA